MIIINDDNTHRMLECNKAIVLDKLLNNYTGIIQCIGSTLVIKSEGLSDECVSSIKKLYSGPVRLEKIEPYFLDPMRPRMELLPMDALIAVAYVQSFGACKHGANSWQKEKNGCNFFTGAALRHISKDLMGDIYDESTMLNLAHACCDLLYSLSFKLREYPLHKYNQDLLNVIHDNLKKNNISECKDKQQDNSDKQLVFDFGGNK